MLTVNRRHSIHKQFQATRDRQICRAWRVERHDKTGRQHRSARWVLAITGLRKPTCTGRMIKKCSLAVIGKVSAPASRIQEPFNYAFIESELNKFCGHPTNNRIRENIIYNHSTCRDHCTITNRHTS